MEQTADPVQIYNRKIQIFKIKQKTQIQQKTRSHRSLCKPHRLLFLLCPFYQKTAQICDRGRAKKQQPIGCVPVHIEEITGDQKPCIAQLFRKSKIQDRHYGKKQQIADRIKNHKFALPF